MKLNNYLSITFVVVTWTILDQCQAGRISSISYNGNWGDWGHWEWCGGFPSRGYAVSFQAQVESKQGRGDDTAMNSICLSCSGGDIICSKKGFWGSWYRSRGTCNSGFTGFNLRYEASCGPRCDDTAANDLELRCKGTWVTINSPTDWGTWNSGHCPAGYVICGLKTRVESKQGRRGDDTALNGVEFACCKK